MPLGFHIGKSGGKMMKALEDSINYLRIYTSRPCGQIFVKGPRGYKDTLTSGEKLEMSEYLSKENVPLIIHGAYVDNSWKNPTKSIENIKAELQICHEIGGKGVIIHLGAAANGENLVRLLTEVSENLMIDKDKIILYLEINAAKPTKNTFETPPKIKNLFDSINQIDTNGLKIGLCIDSAHLFSCGVSFSDRDKTKKWLNKLPDVPLAIHLNDSASIFKSGVDRHEALCIGNIWKDYHPENGSLPIEQSGLFELLEYADNRDIITILERGQGLEEDLELINELNFYK